MINNIQDIHTKIIEMEKVKYIHILPVPSIFSKELINAINNTDIFIKDNHLFLVDENKIFDFSNHYQNVIQVKELKKNQIELINSIHESVKYIFIHFLDFKLSYSIPDKVARKIIWRVWGDDLYYSSITRNTILSKIKGLTKNMIWNFKSKPTIRKFAGIGLADECDIYELRKQKIDVPAFIMPYSFHSTPESLNVSVNYSDEIIKKERDEIFILIGHSANRELKHEAILNNLLRYRNEKIKLIIPLNYGNLEYSKYIARKAQELFPSKVFIIEKKLPYESYVKIMNTVDCAIFDMKRQMALGNIYDLLYFGKPIFLNENNVIFQAMKDKNIVLYETKLLDSLNFDGFEKVLKEHDGRIGIEHSKNIKSLDYKWNKWKIIMNTYK